MRCTYLTVSPHRSNDRGQYWNLNQLSIAYALRLGLGPDLPWADEPSPGNLRFSAGRILTCLIVYSYRHSHFLALQHSFRYTFAALGTLPYRSIFLLIPRFRWCALAPLHFRRRCTRPVSYYALFEWWLLLSQHPGCLGTPTSFST